MIIILGFDALEYDRAKDYDALKLTSFGKMDNNVGYDREITPVLWSTLVTGELPKVHGVTWGGGEDLNAGLKKQIQCPTIFDDIPGSIAILVPNVTLKFYDATKIKKVFYSPNRNFKIEYKDEQLEEMKTMTKRLMKHINKRKAPLVMAYYAPPDAIGHVFPNEEDEHIHLDLYRRMCELTEEIKGGMKPEDILIIVSDHGMKKGDHTKYAWFSCSREVKVPEHITGFKELVVRLWKDGKSKG